MSYVAKHLIPNEEVLYFTRLSWIVYLRAVLVFLIAGVLAVAGVSSVSGVDASTVTLLYEVAGLVFLLGLTLFLLAFIRRRSSEFAVTNKRVIIKIGLLSRRSVEILLAKVEAITVEQTLPGRIFGYGTIIIIGTGGTKEPFHLIGDPLEFRRQSQIAATM